MPLTGIDHLHSRESSRRRSSIDAIIFSRKSSTALATKTKRKMRDLKPGALISIKPGRGRFMGPHRKMAFMATVIDGPFYQEPDDPERLGWWFYKILCYSGIRYINVKHVELFDETD